VYDQTGSLEDTEELSGGKFEDLYEYYRGMFKKVEEEDVIAFEVWRPTGCECVKESICGMVPSSCCADGWVMVQNEYRGSDEEVADLIRLYKKNKVGQEVVERCGSSSTNPCIWPVACVI
jgi:hypothetical protein